MMSRILERLRPDILPRLTLFLGAAIVLAAATDMSAGERVPRRAVPGKTSLRTLLDDSGSLSAIPTVSCSAEGRTRQVYLGLAAAFGRFSEEERCRVASLALHMRGREPIDEVLSFAGSSIGGVQLSSDPAGGVIWLNDFRIEAGGGVRVVTTVGEKSVRFSHDGYLEELVTVQVEPARWVTLHRDLRRP